MKESNEQKTIPSNREIERIDKLVLDWKNGHIELADIAYAILAMVGKDNRNGL